MRDLAKNGSTGWEFDARTFDARAVGVAFRRWGFVLMRGVLDAQAVTSCRATLDAAFATPLLEPLAVIYSSNVLKLDPIWRTIFTDSVVRSLRAALGPELSYQHDLHVQRNCYGVDRWRAATGWHVDAGSELGNRYLHHINYRFAKCGIFLQNFDNGWGGGIRVRPKTHRDMFEVQPLKRGYFFARRVLINRAAATFGFNLGCLALPISAGDLCFFDSRLSHSSATPSRGNVRLIGDERVDASSYFWPQIPPEHTKYVIYWDACNSAMVDDFLSNSSRRAVSEQWGSHEKALEPAVWSRVLSVSYPEDFPAAFVAEATRQRVEIASLPAERAAQYKRKLASMRLSHPCS